MLCHLPASRALLAPAGALQGSGLIDGLVHVPVAEEGLLARLHQRVLLAVADATEVIVVQTPVHDAPQAVLSHVLRLRTPPGAGGWLVKVIKGILTYRLTMRFWY